MGLVQKILFWSVVGLGLVLGIPERVFAASQSPSPENVAAALFSSGLVSVLAVTRIGRF